MEEISKIESMAQENSKLAVQEKELAKQSKEVAELELKRAKARETLAEKEFDLTKIKREWAEKKLNLYIQKIEIRKKGLVEFSDSDLKTEEEAAVYNQKVSEIQEEIAELNTETSTLEKKVAKTMLALAKDKIYAAEQREKLSKKQYEYVKMVKGNQPEHKISTAKSQIEIQQKDLVKARNYIVEKEMEIQGLQNELANLKKRLSNKLSIREKIRHGGVPSE
jgi:chromosome segregation ATPase